MQTAIAGLRKILNTVRQRWNLNGSTPARCCRVSLDATSKTFRVSGYVGDIAEHRQRRRFEIALVIRIGQGTVRLVPLPPVERLARSVEETVFASAARGRRRLVHAVMLGGRPGSRGHGPNGQAPAHRSPGGALDEPSGAITRGRDPRRVRARRGSTIDWR
jgi:hypothetical protein